MLGTRSVQVGSQAMHSLNQKIEHTHTHTHAPKFFRLLARHVRERRREKNEHCAMMVCTRNELHAARIVCATLRRVVVVVGRIHFQLDLNMNIMCITENYHIFIIIPVLGYAFVCLCVCERTKVEKCRYQCERKRKTLLNVPALTHGIAHSLSTVFKLACIK